MSRIATILHLCIVFSVICWHASEPFLGRLLENKKLTFLFQTVIGEGDLISRTYPIDTAEGQVIARNHLRFQQLPLEQQKSILEAYQQFLSQTSSVTFLQKMGESIAILAVKLPPFERAWIFFSILISIMLLRNKPGASTASWIIPLIVLVAFLDQGFSPNARPLSLETRLFPSESYLIKHYMESPPSGPIIKQQQALRDGWNSYLVREWLGEEVSSDIYANKNQIEKAEYLFNLERLNCSIADHLTNHPIRPHYSLAVWLIYCCWNLLFAFMTRTRKIASDKITSPRSNLLEPVK